MGFCYETENLVSNKGTPACSHSSCLCQSVGSMLLVGGCGDKSCRGRHCPGATELSFAQCTASWFGDSTRGGLKKLALKSHYLYQHLYMHTCNVRSNELFHYIQ